MTDKRVLVVDDEEDYRIVMSGHLRRKGYDVLTAENGVEALQALREEDFEVLVTDLMMPRMDGLELLEQAKKADPYLEVVVISGAGTLESAISSMRAGGAYDYLPKPLDTMDDLSLAVDRAAEHRALRVEGKRLQAQIAVERERLQWVIEKSGDALLSSENGRTIAVTNPAAAELFEREALINADAVHELPAPVAGLLENWLRFEVRQPTLTEIAWPAEQVQMVSLTASGDEGSGWVMLLRDVTELRRLQRLKMRLLSRTADEVRARLAGAFSAMVELNELPQAKDEKFTGAVQEAMDDLSAIRGWTDEVLNLAEIEAGSLKTVASESLSAVVQETIASGLPALLEEKGIELETEVADVEYEVHPPIAGRLLQHLIRQAAWRAPSGDQLALSLETSDRQVWLTLRDGGPKLLADRTPELFDSFLGWETEPQPGIGLSLAMVKSAADALGAQVWLRSESEGGNEFMVSFAHESREGEGS